jgi:hypothetical protein
LVVDPPLWKIWKPVGMMTFPTLGENKKKCFKPATSKYCCFGVSNIRMRTWSP